MNQQIFKYNFVHYDFSDFVFGFGFDVVLAFGFGFGLGFALVFATSLGFAIRFMSLS